ncbi:universal stress protein [Hymenobacter amundsenii]|nr:universal stress protein [Hymenobacter amundsenii]
MMSTLLVLTDFFRAADRALDYATNLAQPLGARLVLLHVRRDALLDPERFTGGLSNLSQEAIDLVMNQLAGNLAVPVVAEVGHGRVSDAVADAAGRHHPVLIVLGRPDYSGTPDELVNTTALDILRTSPRPLLVVPHNVNSSSSSSSPRRVLLAADGEPFGLGPYAGPARQVLAALHAALTVLHVAPDSDAAALAAALESVVRTGLEVELPTPVLSISKVAADPAEGILQVAQPADYDLVVLIARPRSFLGKLFHRSVTARVLLHSTVPVLILPATD